MNKYFLKRVSYFCLILVDNTKAGKNDFFQNDLTQRQRNMLVSVIITPKIQIRETGEYWDIFIESISPPLASWEGTVPNLKSDSELETFTNIFLDESMHILHYLL